MADEARELLKRLVDAPSETAEFFIARNAAIDFLAREQDGPVAEGHARIRFYKSGETWVWWLADPSERDVQLRKIMLPLPADALCPIPIVGSVVENQEGNK